LVGRHLKLILFYKFLFSDPDAPSRAEHTKREWHHWLIGNIPGENVSLGETLSGYIGSGPPPKTGTIMTYVSIFYIGYKFITNYQITIRWLSTIM